MLPHWSSLCNVVCLLTIHAIVTALNHQHQKVSHDIVTENGFCPEVFNSNQCMYIQNILRTFFDMYEMRTNREKIKFEEEKSIFVDQIKQVRQEIRFLKKQLK